MPRAIIFDFFFFNDTATTEIYTLSLHDALPIYIHMKYFTIRYIFSYYCIILHENNMRIYRSEEHTSELQSRPHLVCRLLLEKKNEEFHEYLGVVGTVTLAKGGYLGVNRLGCLVK